MPPPPVKGVFGSTGAGIRIDRWVMTRLLELSATFLPVSSCASSQVSLEPPLCPPLPSSPPQSTHQRGGHPTLLPLGDEHPPPRRSPLGTPRSANRPPGPRPGSRHEFDVLSEHTIGTGGTAVEDGGRCGRLPAEQRATSPPRGKQRVAPTRRDDFSWVATTRWPLSPHHPTAAVGAADLILHNSLTATRGPHASKTRLFCRVSGRCRCR